MSSNLPVALGGRPVRESGTYRTTPEVGDREVEYTSAQILSADWEPDATRGGLPVREGLSLPSNVAEALGVEQAALSAEFADVHAKGQPVHVVPLNNGTHAIRLFLAALTKAAPALGLRVPAVGDEVIVPALTWQATAGAVLRRNMVPVLVDVKPGTLCMDAAAAASAVTERTVGIIPVHLYHTFAPMMDLLTLAQRHRAAVLEDCAHAHGARYQGQAAGTIGLAGSFSGQGSKSFTAQELGLLIILMKRRGEQYARQLLADQYISEVTCGRHVGLSRMLQADNDRTAGVLAALGRAQLERFEEQNQRRVETFAAFDAQVADLAPFGITGLEQEPGVNVPPTYKKPFRVDLTQWRGMTLDQIAHTLGLDLGCEIVRIYHPLAGEPDPIRAGGNPYDPHTDPALNINPDYWNRIDRRRYEAPNAWEAFHSVLVIEHAAGLDDGFPQAFAEAVARNHAHAERLAAEVQA